VVKGLARWPLVPMFAGSNPAEAVEFFRAKKSSVVKPSVPCRRSAACKKNPYIWHGSRHLSAKLPDISRPKFPLSLPQVSRVVGDVEAPGGASGNFQSRVRTISLHDCGTYGGISLRGPTEEEEEEEVTPNSYSPS
jgi:hypothetical protein